MITPQNSQNFAVKLRIKSWLNAKINRYMFDKANLKLEIISLLMREGFGILMSFGTLHQQASLVTSSVSPKRSSLWKFSNVSHCIE